MANIHKHTDSPVIHMVVEPRAMIGSNLDTCKRGPPANEINGL